MNCRECVFEIKDEFYILSMDGADMGAIVEFRSGNILAHQGANFFDIMEFSNKEMDFLSENLFAFKKNPVLAIDVKKRRAVLFFRNFVFSSHICFAFAFLLPAADVCIALTNNINEEIIISDTAKSLCSRTYKFDENVYSYVSDVIYKYRCMLIPELDTYAALIKNTVTSASEICYIDVNCIIEAVDLNDKMAQTDIIFSEGFCDAALFISMLFARRYAVRRNVDIFIKPGKDCFYIDFVFELYDDSFVDYGIRFLEELSLKMNVLFYFTADKRQVKISFAPFYPDIGLTGVKNPLVFKSDI